MMPAQKGMNARQASTDEAAKTFLRFHLNAGAASVDSATIPASDQNAILNGSTIGQSMVVDEIKLGGHSLRAKDFPLRERSARALA